jgi:NADP-dependent 3-hydroxy acid dehydrogenase YdfG
MNIDLVGTQVRVSGIDPGAAETEFSNVRFHGDDERADKVYEGYTPLAAQDIADAVSYVVNAPPHVNVLQMVIECTAQRSAAVLYREGA